MASNGTALRNYRNGHRVSAQELAEHLGWSHASQVTRRERGKLRMTIQECMQYMAAVDAIVAERNEQYQAQIVVGGEAS